MAREPKTNTTRELIDAIHALTVEIKGLREDIARTRPPKAETPPSKGEAPEGPEAALERVFEAAMVEDESEGWEVFLTMVHPSQMDTAHACGSLRQFVWTSIRRNLSRYLGESPAPGGFTISRRIPESIEEGDTQAKLFLCAAGRQPVPVSFQRASATSPWLLSASSL